MNEVDFDSILGKHVLDTAVIESVITHENTYYEDSNRFAFGLDGKVFVATEDPSDGYRSYLKSFEVTDDTSFIKGAAPIKRKVLVTRMSDDYNSVNDVLVFTDVETGHIWMRIGTANTDDYYPYCVLDWHPMKPI